MANIINLVGLKFERLTVISQSKERGNKGQIKWDCVCDCGNKHTVTGESLRSGKSKSCGCLKRNFIERNKFPREYNRENAILKVQYSHLKRRNSKFGEELLTFEEFKIKSKDKCNYCGLEYSRVLEDRLNETKNGKQLSGTVIKINGLDRVDSNKCYSYENTVTCCKYCNTAKNTMTVSEFMEWVKRVYNHNF